MKNDLPSDEQKRTSPFGKERIKLGYQNYCKCGPMAKCTAGPSWKDQCLCKYSNKSSIADRCMHYRANIGGHCDCVSAQKEISCKPRFHRSRR